jgi:DNA-binding XRE family transcriptional regulator
MLTSLDLAHSFLHSFIKKMQEPAEKEIQLTRKQLKMLEMERETYKPVKLNIAQALDTAKDRAGFNEAWDGLEEEYKALNALLCARQEAGLTQEELAVRMGTTKSAICRLESSLRDQKHSPSFSTLKKYANACGKKLVVQIV